MRLSIAALIVASFLQTAEGETNSRHEIFDVDRLSTDTIFSQEKATTNSSCGTTADATQEQTLNPH